MLSVLFFFFFNDTATTEIYTLSLHDALPIYTFAEDADLTLKILAGGWKIYYEPNSVSYTEAPVKLQQLMKQRYSWTRGILQSIRKHKKLMLNPTINFGDTF